MRRLFVTGTDTGVGKSTISCALLAAWRRSGKAVAGFKPIETGCKAAADGTLIPEDALRLARAAGDPAPRPDCCPIRFGVPASPEAAAKAEARTIDLGAADAAFDRFDAEVVLIEGAGGLLVPIGADLTMADLAKRWGATLLIVARASLGTINHTLLTIEAAQRRGLHISGVVLNRTNPPGPDDADNADAIRRHGRVPVLGTFPLLPEASFERLADLAERSLDLQALWNAI